MKFVPAALVLGNVHVLAVQNPVLEEQTQDLQNYHANGNYSHTIYGKEYACIQPAHRYDNYIGILKTHSWEQIHNWLQENQLYDTNTGQLLPPPSEDQYFSTDITEIFNEATASAQKVIDSGGVPAYEPGSISSFDYSYMRHLACCSSTWPQGKSYLWFGGDVRAFSGDDHRCDCNPVGSESADPYGLSCCSQKLTSDNKCDCIAPGDESLPFDSNLYRPLVVDSDCCYNGDESEGIQKETDGWYCGKRKCAHKGENANTSPSGICCWKNETALYNRDSTDDEGLTCGCTPTGHMHDSKLGAVASDCCSGSYSDADSRVCGCIQDHAPVNTEQERNSCCSGQTIEATGISQTYCKAENCTLPGAELAGDGSHCCVDGDQIVQGICPCLPGGEPTEHSQYCCTNTRDENGHCTWFGVDHVVEEWKPVAACYSGEFKDSESRKCNCVEYNVEKLPGATPEYTPAEQYCCSQSYIHAGDNKDQCSCLRAGQHSSSADHCCSKRLDASGHCECASPGSPVRTETGMRTEDCCSDRAADGFCQCRVKSTNGPGCCGTVDAAGECGCIAGHHQLPSTEVADPDSVCCHSTSNCSDMCAAAR